MPVVPQVSGPLGNSPGAAAVYVPFLVFILVKGRAW